MLNKITLLLSMTLNLVLALIVFENNKPIKAVDFRDALSDTPTTSQLMNNSLASAIPVPVTPVVAAPVPVTPAIVAPDLVALAPVQATAPVSEVTPVVAAVPVKTVAPIKTAALMIKSGNDWAAYKKDAADDSDVVISNIFRSKTKGEKAVTAAVRRNIARGKDILFSCVLPEKSGGVFYVIRMAPPSAPAPRAAAPGWKYDQGYSDDLSAITHKDETDIQEMF